MFAGLWGIADREGRLEDRPLRIKADVFPYDAVDVDELLTQLHDKGFIFRYITKDSRFIAILKFRSHQHPHIKEPKSTIPAPDKHQTSTRQALTLHPSGPAVIDPVMDPVTGVGNSNGNKNKNQLISKAGRPNRHTSGVIKALEGFTVDGLEKRGVDPNPELTKAALAQTAEEQRVKGRKFR